MTVIKFPIPAARNNPLSQSLEASLGEYYLPPKGMEIRTDVSDVPFLPPLDDAESNLAEIE